MCNVIFEGGINFFYLCFSSSCASRAPLSRGWNCFSESDIRDGCALFFFKVATHFFLAYSFI